MRIGDWWIDRDGSVTFSDGDAGVEIPNHDGVVSDYLAREVLETVGLDAGEFVGDLDVWAETNEEHADALREARFVGERLYDLVEHPAVVARWPEEDQRRAAVQVAHGGGDPSGYAVRYLGWKRLKDTSVETWAVGPEDLRAIADGICEAVNGDSGYERVHFDIDARSTRTFYERIPWVVLDAGKPGALRDYARSY